MGRTFRVFVSSTFADMKAERNALQERVFPRIRDRCRRRGFRFQAIDLRWGVSDEAALDQQTLQICLRELQRCQKISPRPNFIVLLGDRYGWNPLPPRVDAVEFARLLEAIKERDRGVVTRWYRRDDNAIPPHYVLLPRTAEFVAAEHWEVEERKLLGLLRRAAQKLSRKDGGPAWGKYFQSATHQEVIEGILARPEARDHVFAYLRELCGSRGNSNLDVLPDGSRDREAWKRQQALKKEVQRRLPAKQVRRFRPRVAWPWLRWNSPANDPDPDYLDAFCRSVETDLTRIIDEEMARQAAFSDEELEEFDHLRFAEERSRHFVGRTAELCRIADHLAKPNPFPLVVRGRGGSGKTALLAKAFLESGRKASAAGGCHARFIGATPGSTHLRSLLTDLGLKIGREMGAELGEPPGEMHRLEIWFHQHLRLASRDRPLILFLDALDQFSGADDPHTLSWLPRPLPEHVRMVISVLEQSEESPGLAAATARRVFPETDQLSLPPLPSSDGEALLRSWLTESGRTLREPQFRAILEAFASSGLPLWLRLAFDQARAWRSFDEPQSLPTSVPRLIDARLDELSRPAHHGPVLVRKALGYLAASRRGLSEDELLDLLALDEECWMEFLRRAYHELPPGQRRLPVIYWARLLGDLEHYLTERRTGNAVLLGFYHRELGDRIAERFLGPDERHRFHETSALYFEGQETWGEPLTEPRQRGPGPRPVNDRKADELPWQRLQWIRQLRANGIPWESKAGECLGELFCRLEFLESKAEGGLVFDLVAEITEAADLLPPAHPRSATLRLVGEALRRHSHFLSRHPTALFQCLWNQCWWHDCPEAASHFEGELVPSVPPSGLHRLVEAWRDEKEASSPGFLWIRSLRPPALPLGQGFVSTLDAGEAAVRDVVFASGERRVIASCQDGSIRVWDLQDGRQVRCLQGLGEGAGNLVVSEDGERAFSGSDDGYVTVWDLIEGMECRRWQATRVRVSAIALAPDGHTLATGDEAGEVMLWNAETGQLLQKFAGHQSPVRCLAFGPQGDRLASGSGAQVQSVLEKSPDCSIRVWSVREGKELIVFRDHQQTVTSCAFSRDGKRLFTGSWDETVRVRDLGAEGDGKVLNGYDGLLGPVTVLKLLDDDTRLATTHFCHNSYGYYTAPLRVYDLTQDREVLQVPEATDLNGLAVSSSGRLLAVVSAGTIRVFLSPGGKSAAPQLRTAAIGVGFTLSPDGGTLMWRNEVIGVGVFGCAGWDLATWKEFASVPEEAIERAGKAARENPGEWSLGVAGAETHLTETATGVTAAWYPHTLEGATFARNGRMWVAKQGDYIHLITLEGSLQDTN